MYACTGLAGSYAQAGKHSSTYGALQQSPGCPSTVGCTGKWVGAGCVWPVHMCD